jgi:1-deoxy-D-xylulose-5-phosphate reductoisomerase
LGVPDMRVPISYALSFPQRIKQNDYRLDLAKMKNLTFLNPDNERFPALKLAYRAAKTGGTMPVVLNAANEMAVEAFLDGKIGFYDIINVVEKTMSRHRSQTNENIEHILQTDRWTRIEAKQIIEGIKR